MGAEETFEEDLRDRPALQRELLGQAVRVGRRLRAAGLRGRVVTLKVKYGDFSQITRRVTLGGPTDDDRTMYDAARAQLERVDLSRPVRLTGISVSGFEPPGRGQLGLFPGAGQEPPMQARRQALNTALDAIAGRFGEGAVVRADLADRPRRGEGGPEEIPTPPAKADPRASAFRPAAARPSLNGMMRREAKGRRGGDGPEEPPGDRRPGGGPACPRRLARPVPGGGGLRLLRVHRHLPRHQGPRPLRAGRGTSSPPSRCCEGRGFRTELTDAELDRQGLQGPLVRGPHLLVRERVAVVDDAWFEHARRARIMNVEVPAGAAGGDDLVEELRPGAGALRRRGREPPAALRAEGRRLEPALARFEPYWEVLFSHLLLFRFAYPGSRDVIPDWVMEGLVGRTLAERAEPGHRNRVCRGNLMSRVPVPARSRPRAR